MVHKIEEYKAHVEAKLKREQEKQSLEEQSLFKNDYIEELHSFSISLSGSQEAKVSSIAREIKDRLELVDRLKEDLKVLH